MSQDINEAYDGEISDYLIRARGYISKASRLASEASHLYREEQQSLAIVGIANVLLAAVIMLVKESPP